eukprot:m.59852 g.59852  ORF g.59852 m.59852 type:complete len:305 (-) comp6985_c0_seq1:301-1215(-)
MAASRCRSTFRSAWKSGSSKTASCLPSSGARCHSRPSRAKPLSLQRRLTILHGSPRKHCSSPVNGAAASLRRIACRSTSAPAREIVSVFMHPGFSCFSSLWAFLTADPARPPTRADPAQSPGFDDEPFKVTLREPMLAPAEPEAVRTTLRPARQTSIVGMRAQAPAPPGPAPSPPRTPASDLPPSRRKSVLRVSPSDLASSRDISPTPDSSTSKRVTFGRMDSLGATQRPPLEGLDMTLSGKLGSTLGTTLGSTRASRSPASPPALLSPLPGSSPARSPCPCPTCGTVSTGNFCTECGQRIARK